MSFAATWMDLEIIILSEVTQKEKERYYMISLICEIYFLKVTNTNEFIHKTETHKQTQKTNL